MANATTRERPKITFDHLASAKKPVTGVQYVPTNVEAQLAAEEADSALSTARLIGDPERIAKAEADLKAKLAIFHRPENSVRIDFKSIGRDKFDELKSHHPPTEQQLAEGKEKGESVDWNIDTFLPVLIAASVTSPPMTPEQVRSLTKPVEVGGYEWNQGEVFALFNEAVRVNVAGRIGSYSF